MGHERKKPYSSQENPTELKYTRIFYGRNQSYLRQAAPFFRPKSRSKYTGNVFGVYGRPKGKPKGNFKKIGTARIAKKINYRVHKSKIWWSPNS